MSETFLPRDEDNVLHVVALSGGHDSTCLSLLLQEREPRPYVYVCTPTGDELPEMFAHWNALSKRLGSRIQVWYGSILIRRVQNLARKFGSMPSSAINADILSAFMSRAASNV